jgi:hypothetical protein
MLKLALAAVAVLCVAGSAWAYWTTQGSGSANASVGTLSAPGNVTATAGASSVSVGWTGSTISNGTPAQGYYVTRTDTSNSQTAPACGSSASSLITSTSCSDTSVPNGTYTYSVTAVYRTWSAVGTSGTVTLAGDTTPPTVQSINRSASSPTNASSVGFDVTFSETVTGVNSSDFALAASGVTGASITGVSGSGASYTVTVSTGSGSGTLGLNLVDDDTIRDTGGTKLGGGGTGNGNFTGQTYTIDRVAPVVTVTKVNGSTVSFPFTTGQNVTSVGGACGTLSGDSASVSVTIDGSPSVPATASCSAGSWTLTLTTALSTGGNHTIAATQADTAGNSGSSGNQTVSIDKTAPTVGSMNRSASSPTNASSVGFDVTFSETVTGVNTSDFALAASGVTGASITGVSGSGASYTVTVSTGSGSGTLGLNLVDDDTIQDGVANKLGGNGTGNGNFTGQAYTIDRNAPTTISINRSATSPTNASSVGFDVTFSETVTGVNSSDFALAASGVTGASITGVSGSGASYTVTVSTGSGSGTLGLNLVDDDTIRDSATNRLGGTGTGNGNFTGQVYAIDKTGPTLTISSCTGGSGHKNTITGTTNENTGTVTVKIFTGTGIGGTLTFTLTDPAPFSGSSTPFTWSVGTGSGDLTAGSTYTSQATQTDALGNPSNAPTCTFSAN